MNKPILYLTLSAIAAGGCASLLPDQNLQDRVDTVVTNQDKKEKAALLVIGPEYDLMQSILASVLKGEPELLWSAQWMGELLLNEGYRKEDIIVLTLDYVDEIKRARTQFPDREKERIFDPRNVYRLSVPNYSHIINQFRENPPDEFFLYVCTHGSKQDEVLRMKVNNLLFSRGHDVVRRLSEGRISREQIMNDLY